MKSNHQRFRDLGYVVIKVIKEGKLEEGLYPVLLDKARGIFTSVKILPSTVALEGELFKPEEESDLVYGLYNPDNPEVKEMIEEYQGGPVANLMHLTDSEGTYFPLNKDYQETILNLAKK